jgi:hypothetical protein
MKIKLSRWLLSAIICWAFSLTLWVNYSWGQEWERPCVPRAIDDAWSYEMQTGQPSRIVLMDSYVVGQGHAQAQGWNPEINDWVYLTTHDKDGKLRTWGYHFPHTPNRYLSLDEFIDEMKKVRRRSSHER